MVTCTDGRHATLAGATLKDLEYRHASVLDNGIHAWNMAGLPVEKGLTGIMNPPNDVLPMLTESNWADAIYYLQWEEELGKKRS